MQRLDTRYGSLLVPDPERDLISRFLSAYGEWAYHEARFVAAAMPRDGRLLDIGAFVGTFGLGVAREIAVSSICFVEANGEIFDLLEENVAANCQVPFSVVHAMVGPPGNAANGRYTEQGNFGSLSFAQPLDDAPVPGGNVEAPRVVSLADLREGYGPFDLIKIDAEGMEMEILRSDEAEITNGNATLWLECNEDSASLDLGDLLLEYQLNVWYFAFDSFSSDNFRRNPEPVFPFGFEAGLLAGKRLSPKMAPSNMPDGCFLVPVESREDLRRAMWKTPRGAPREWLAESREQIAAEGVRALLRQDFGSFLVPQTGNGPEPVEKHDEAALLNAQLIQVTQQLAEVQESIPSRLAEARTSADQRVHAQLTRLQNELATAECVAVERARTILALTEQLAQAHQELARLEQVVTCRQTEIAADRTRIRALQARLEAHAVNHRE